MVDIIGLGSPISMGEKLKQENKNNNFASMEKITSITTTEIKRESKRISKLINDSSAKRLSKLIKDSSAKTLSKLIKHSSAKMLSRLIKHSSAKGLSKLIKHSSAKMLSKLIKHSSAKGLSKLIKHSSAKTLSKLIKDSSGKRLSKLIKHSSAKRSEEKTEEKIFIDLTTKGNYIKEGSIVETKKIKECYTNKKIKECYTNKKIKECCTNKKIEECYTNKKIKECYTNKKIKECYTNKKIKEYYTNKKIKECYTNKKIKESYTNSTTENIKITPKGMPREKYIRILNDSCKNKNANVSTINLNPCVVLQDILKTTSYSSDRNKEDKWRICHLDEIFSQPIKSNLQFNPCSPLNRPQYLGKSI